MTGHGSFGDVNRVMRRSDKSNWALKLIIMEKLSSEDRKRAFQEVDLLKFVSSNEFVISAKDAFFDAISLNLCIVMEYADDGDLSGKIFKAQARDEDFDLNQIWSYVIQLVLGVKELHAAGVVHRDIKPANVFCFSDETIRIGDFNVSKRKEKDKMLKTQTGTPFYACPEIYQSQPYDEKADIWSLGCLFYELCMLNPPFDADGVADLSLRIRSGAYDPPHKKFGSDLILLISKMLSLNPANRPSAQEIYETEMVQSRLCFLPERIKKLIGYEDKPPEKPIDLMTALGVPSEIGEDGVPKSKENRKPHDWNPIKSYLAAGKRFTQSIGGEALTGRMQLMDPSKKRAFYGRPYKYLDHRAEFVKRQQGNYFRPDEAHEAKKEAEAKKVSPLRERIMEAYSYNFPQAKIEEKEGKQEKEKEKNKKRATGMTGMSGLTLRTTGNSQIGGMRSMSLDRDPNEVQGNQSKDKLLPYRKVEVNIWLKYEDPPSLKTTKKEESKSSLTKTRNGTATVNATELLSYNSLVTEERRRLLEMSDAASETRKPGVTESRMGETKDTRLIQSKRSRIREANRNEGFLPSISGTQRSRSGVSRVQNQPKN